MVGTSGGMDGVDNEEKGEEHVVCAGLQACLVSGLQLMRQLMQALQDGSCV